MQKTYKCNQILPPDLMFCWLIIIRELEKIKYLRVTLFRLRIMMLIWEPIGHWMWIFMMFEGAIGSCKGTCCTVGKFKHWFICCDPGWTAAHILFLCVREVAVISLRDSPQVAQRQMGLLWDKQFIIVITWNFNSCDAIFRIISSLIMLRRL